MPEMTMNSSSSGPAIYWSLALVPVQEWIADARRSRDLRVGSAFLSWTMAKILRSLQRDLNATVLLPSEASPGLFAGIGDSKFGKVLEKVEYSLPNRASGYLADDLTIERARTFFEEGISRCPDQAWAALRQEIQTKNGSGHGAGRETWQSITACLGAVPTPIQAVWCVKRVAGPDGLKLIDDLFSAVKRTRPLPQQNQGAPVGKCSQCGKREAIGGSEWHEWRSFQYRLDALPAVQQGYRLETGERLCPVCCMKRFAGYLSDASFPSTNEIAVKDWLERVAREKHELVDELKRCVRQVPGTDETQGGDPFPFYFPRTVERHLQQETVPPAPDLSAGSGQATALRKVKEAQAKIATTIVESNKRSDVTAKSKPEPSNYLAVVTFDGDSMGEKVQKHPGTLPPKLMNFASDLGPWINDCNARAFYLGGDEGLILCPIERLWELLAKTHAAWEQRVSETTLSAGATIFDRERPLGAATEAARAALAMAKALDRKDGLAVCVQTASGSEWTAVDHWGGSWVRLRTALKLVCEGRISAGWAHDVEEFLRDLPDSAWQVTATRDAIRTEIRRLTERRTTLRDDVDRVWRAELDGDKWFEKAPDPVALRCLSSQLHLLAFLSRETRP